MVNNVDPCVVVDTLETSGVVDPVNPVRPFNIVVDPCDSGEDMLVSPIGVDDPPVGADTVVDSPMLGGVVLLLSTAEHLASSVITFNK